jgi:hypothetical protein
MAFTMLRFSIALFGPFAATLDQAPIEFFRTKSVLMRNRMVPLALKGKL